MELSPVESWALVFAIAWLVGMVCLMVNQRRR